MFENEISGEWTRAGSESGISGLGIDDSVGSIDAHQNISHPQHLTSTPLRSLRDGNNSKTLQPTVRGKMYLSSASPIPNKPEENVDNQNLTVKKISQGSDCQSFADSGIACDRMDSTMEYDVTEEHFCKEGRRSQRYYKIYCLMAPTVLIL